MIRRTLRSPYSLVALAIAALSTFYWWSSGGVWGELPKDRLFLMTSGWVAFSLFLIVTAFILRKYCHKLGISPEFRMRVSREQLERAENRVGQLRMEVYGGRLTDPKEIEKQARRILREEEVKSCVSIILEETEGKRYPKIVPAQPLGKLSGWVRMHLFLGLAAGLLVAFHGGLEFDSTIAWLLNGSALLVLASGLIGLVDWAIGPTLLTRLEQSSPQLSAERAHGLLVSLTRVVQGERDQVAELVGGPQVLLSLRRDPEARESHVTNLTEKQRESVDSWLVAADQLDQVSTRYQGLMRAKFLIHAWRLVHIPATVILWAAIIVHAITIYWY